LAYRCADFPHRRHSAEGFTPSQRISRNVVALFHATSTYRIRPSGIFPSRQPYASQRRFSLVVVASSSFLPPSVARSFPVRRIETRPFGISRCHFRPRLTSFVAHTVKTVNASKIGHATNRSIGIGALPMELRLESRTFDEHVKERGPSTSELCSTWTSVRLPARKRRGEPMPS
jgi:hypothetical protein